MTCHWRWAYLHARLNYCIFYFLYKAWLFSDCRLLLMDELHAKLSWYCIPLFAWFSHWIESFWNILAYFFVVVKLCQNVFYTQWLFVKERAAQLVSIDISFLTFQTWIKSNFLAMSVFCWSPAIFNFRPKPNPLPHPRLSLTHLHNNSKCNKETFRNMFYWLEKAGN